MHQRAFPIAIPMLLAVACGLIASACRGETVDHTFEFNAMRDSPGIEILDYRYGESNLPLLKNPDYLARQGRAHQQTAVTGLIERPQSLYVKWRVIAEDRIYEDNVDLQARLPRSLHDSIVYFLVNGSQLYVFVVYGDARQKNSVANGPKKYQGRRVVTIYP